MIKIKNKFLELSLFLKFFQVLLRDNLKEKYKTVAIPLPIKDGNITAKRAVHGAFPYCS